MFIKSWNILNLKKHTRITKKKTKKLSFISRIKVACPWFQYLQTAWLKDFSSLYSWHGFHPSAWTSLVSKQSPQIHYSLKTQPHCSWMIELLYFREFLHCSWRLLLKFSIWVALQNYSNAMQHPEHCKGLKNGNAISLIGQVDVDNKLWSRQQPLPSSVWWPMR